MTISEVNEISIPIEETVNKRNDKCIPRMKLSRVIWMKPSLNRVCVPSP